MPTDTAPLTMRLALDSDIFTDWRYQKPHTMQQIREYRTRFGRFPQLTAMTVFEARFGFENKIAKSPSVDERLERDRQGMEDLIRLSGVLEIEERTTAIAAYISARLSQSERNRLRADIFIAATSLAHGYGVATRNHRDFELIGQHLPPQHSTLHLAIWKP